MTDRCQTTWTDPDGMRWVPFDDFRALRGQLDAVTKCPIGIPEPMLCSSGTCYTCLGNANKGLREELQRVTNQRNYNRRLADHLKDNSSEWNAALDMAAEIANANWQGARGINLEIAEDIRALKRPEGELG